MLATLFFHLAWGPWSSPSTAHPQQEEAAEKEVEVEEDEERKKKEDDFLSKVAEWVNMLISGGTEMNCERSMQGKNTFPETTWKWECLQTHT